MTDRRRMGRAWHFWAAVPVLGAMQIFAWGSSYYAPAVLLPHMVQDTGWSTSFILGSVSLSLLAGGACTPLAARTIAAGRGAWCLGGSSLLFALGLSGLGLAESRALFVLSWLLLGAGMGCGLYDAAFSILQMGCGHDRARARQAITALTLVGGFASTCAWPVLSALTQAWGWRATCLALGAAHATVGLALNVALAGWCFAPTLARDADAPAGPVADARPPGRDLRFATLVAAFTALAFISVAVTSNILALLQGLGAHASMAVGAVLWFGPAQVGARLVEMCWGRHWHPRWTAMAGGLLFALGLGALLCFGGAQAGMLCAIVACGAGNGLQTIARGTLPLALYPQDYVRRLGMQARCILFGQALAPLVLGLLWNHLSTRELVALLLGLAVVGSAALCLAVLRRTAPC